MLWFVVICSDGGSSMGGQDGVETQASDEGKFSAAVAGGDNDAIVNGWGDVGAAIVRGYWGVCG